MAFTVTLTELSFFMIAVAFLVLVVSLIPAIIQLRQTGKALQELSDEGKKLCEELQAITHSVKGQVGDLEETIKEIKGIGHEAAGIARIVLKALKGPAVALSGVVAGITFGLQHFRKEEKEDVTES